ncbi:MAG: hypothetical protein NE334_14855 [Lentisphaeraceae bacterium]|nr:hypothetical protein [Lentisphaeraceae bacterium]
MIKVHDRWKWYPKAELEELLVSYKKKELSEAKYLKAKAKLLEEYQYLCHEYDEQIFLNSKYEQNK